MLEVFLLSMLPVVELRGSIPMGVILLDLNWPLVLLLGIIGSFIPAVVIVLGLDKVFYLLEKFSGGTSWTNWVRRYSKRRSKLVEKWGLIGLVILVAIPLPFTGAWTGSLVASGLRLPAVKSLVCILGGLVIAGGLVTGLCLQGV